MINLKLERIAKKLSQNDLAKSIDVKAIMISRWETGRSKPSIETLEKLADALETTTDKLLGRKNESKEVT